MKRIIESFVSCKLPIRQNQMSINRVCSSYVNKMRHEPSRHMRQRLKNPYDLLVFSLNRKYDMDDDGLVDEILVDENVEEEEEEDDQHENCRDDDDIDMVDGQFINYLQGRHLLDKNVNNKNHGDSLLASCIVVETNDNCSSNETVTKFLKQKSTKRTKIIPNQNCKLRSLLDRIFNEVEKYASKYLFFYKFLYEIENIERVNIRFSDL